jgi:hypothetical protein
MQSEPQRSRHGIPLVVGATSRVKIHRGCTDYFIRTRRDDNRWKISICFFFAEARALPRREFPITSFFAQASARRKARALSRRCQSKRTRRAAQASSWR